jgi:glucose-6-phosphate 1-dehydrogenase
MNTDLKPLDPLVQQATPREKLTVPPLPKADPCIIVIFGATGDLTKRKLIPALYDLARAGCMSGRFEVVGVARKPMTDAEFRESLRESTRSSRDAREYDDVAWDFFAQRLHFLAGDITNSELYPELRKKLEEMGEVGSAHNQLFYVSTPASLAPPIIAGLRQSKLNQNLKGWSRIILEKPFGRDLQSARVLNKVVTDVFPEEAVYRIDHYLGKETVQNILVFRFGNSLWEPVWNRNYIDYVEITAAEKLGVENRAAFYEETGALRDMVANHLLQLLTLTAMEPPIAFDADSVREQKVQVLRSIRPMTVDEVAAKTVRGQYGPGEIDGERVPGYREEPGVASKSNAETFVAVKFAVDNWRWSGVPFYVRTGKRLGKNLAQVRVHFKRTPQTLFSRTPDDDMSHNTVTMRIQPNEGISVEFNAKRPGTSMRAVAVHADFSYVNAFGKDTPVAYETLLLDAMRGEATLFTRRDEVEAEWKIITPIEMAWAQLGAPNLPNYAAGSDGPVEADRLINEDGHSWSKL